jgi:hypothetical protein
VAGDNSKLNKEEEEKKIFKIKKIINVKKFLLFF